MHTSPCATSVGKKPLTRNKDLWGKLLTRSFPHTPFKNSRTKVSKNKAVSLRIDGRREIKPRFCYRELLGTTEALGAKKVDLLPINVKEG